MQSEKTKIPKYIGNWETTFKEIQQDEKIYVLFDETFTGIQVLSSTTLSST